MLSFVGRIMQLHFPGSLAKTLCRKHKNRCFLFSLAEVFKLLNFRVVGPI